MRPSLNRESGDKVFGSGTGWIQDHFTSWDGTRLFYRFYPVPKARHTLVLLHGYGEHSGRYEKFPARMPNLSARMAVMDFRGMGRSEGARGTVHCFEGYLRDVSAFLDHLRAKHDAPVPVILLGHSMGGLVATCWALRNPACVKMLILSAPFMGLAFAGFWRLFNRIVLMFAPRFVYRNPVRSTNLSHDDAEIASHRGDPMIQRFVSAHLMEELLKTMAWLRRQPILSLPVPVHMLLAGSEHIVDPKASSRFLDRLVAPRKERTVFEGFYHEIFNERDQRTAFNVLKTILEDCV